MKRYNIMAFGRSVFDAEIGAYAAESISGDWVKYEDVAREKALAVAQAIIVLEKKKIDDFISNGYAYKESCNCAYMYNIITNNNSINLNAEWICPIHGYKKR